MTVTCEHGIRQYQRKGLPTPGCHCGHASVPNGKPEVQERPVDWPWLYGKDEES